MAKAKVEITINDDILSRIDHLVAEQAIPNRSIVIEQAVKEKIDRLDKTLLARECAKLDPSFEKQLAEEGLSGNLTGKP